MNLDIVKKTLTRAFPVGFTAALLLSGCVQYTYTSLSEAQVIHFAQRGATKAGIPLADFEPTPVLALKGDRWSVIYQHKTTPANPEAVTTPKAEKNLLIWVNNLTGAAEVSQVSQVSNEKNEWNERTPNPRSRPGWPPLASGSPSPNLNR
jgi:hypothetical protein